MMENTGQVRDKFHCRVMMNAQHAIFCFESLTMQQLVILYELKHHHLTDMLASWMVRDSKEPPLPSPSNLIKTKNMSGTTMLVFVSLFRQPDYNQRKQAAEETAGLGTVVVLPDAVRLDKEALI